MNKLFPSLIIILLLFSCSTRTRINADDVKCIDFYAMAKGIERCCSIKSFSDIRRQGNDTTIYDREFINAFMFRVNKMKPTKSTNGDFRSAAVIWTNADESFLVMFGERWGIRYGNQYMKDDSVIFQLIDTYIYDTQLWDYWFPESSRREMRERVEIIRKEEEKGTMQNRGTPKLE